MRNAESWDRALLAYAAQSPAVRGLIQCPCITKVFDRPAHPLRKTRRYMSHITNATLAIKAARKPMDSRPALVPDIGATRQPIRSVLALTCLI